MAAEPDSKETSHSNPPAEADPEWQGSFKQSLDNVIEAEIKLIEEDPICKKVFDNLEKIFKNSNVDIKRWMLIHGMNRKVATEILASWKKLYPDRDISDPAIFAEMCLRIATECKRIIIHESGTTIAKELAEDDGLRKHLDDYIECNSDWQKLQSPSEPGGEIPEVTEETKSEYLKVHQRHLELITELIRTKIDRCFEYYPAIQRNLLLHSLVRVFAIDQFFYVEFIKSYPVFWYEYYNDNIWTLAHFVMTTADFKKLNIWDQKIHSLHAEQTSGVASQKGAQEIK